MKTSLLAGCAFALAQTLASPLLAADRVVTIVNNSGYTIVEFYGSNNGTTDWQEDILGADVLLHGASININFDDATGHCIFDFLAIFEDAEQVVQEDVDVCKIGTFTFE